MSQTGEHCTPQVPEGRRVLGIEGGGTKTEWVQAEVSPDGSWREVAGGLLPASNLRLVTDAQLTALLAVLPCEVDDVGIYLAGCATEEDRARLRQLAVAAWPEARLSLGSDRDSALAASFQEGDGIVVIAGTGAAVHGRCGERVEKAGGWGQLLGDRGSGYHLAMRGLRCVLSTYDIHGEVSPLARQILRTLGLNRLQDLVDWVSAAEKMDVARLAPAIFAAAREGDTQMQEILRDGAEIQAEFTEAVARRLGRLDLPVRLFGGIFTHHPEYGALVAEYLGRLLPQAPVALCERSGAWGALWLAAQPHAPVAPLPRPEPMDASVGAELAQASTEQRNPRSAHLDDLPTGGLVQLFIAEEDYVAQALAGARAEIVRAADLLAESMRRGARLFYVGAGTSGRLGVLDASEIPPTFGTAPEQVQGIMAGGVQALHRSVEGAEDQPTAGAQAILERGVTSSDVVCGIAASGRTPFVLGALQQARTTGAQTILLTSNPARRRAQPAWDVEIDLATGPELVTGSTRLKAGTATKLVLNILTTCAMIRLGKVRGNQMINVSVSNEKLRLRAIRLVAEILQIPEAEARERLDSARWSVAESLSRAKAACT